MGCVKGLGRPGSPVREPQPGSVGKDLLIGGWFVLVIALLVGFRAYTRNSGRRIPESSPMATPQRTYVGSLRWTRKRGFGGGGVNQGSGRLSVFDWGVQLSPSSPLLSQLVPTVDLRFGEIGSAGVGTSHAALSECVEIRAPQPDFFVVFRTPQWSEILDALRAHGVDVDGTPTPFRTLSWPDR